MTMAALTDDGEAEGAAPHEATYRRRGPGPWDVHVGQRIKEARTIRGLSQQALGKTASISFQQVQKYENGVNRVSPDRLVAFAEALSVTPGWFFEGKDGVIGKAPTDRPLDGLTASDLTIARDIARLPQPVRQKVVGLVRVLAE